MATETTRPKMPANRHYVFAKNCWNSHGRFNIGDKARGAFSEALVRSYLQAGILVEAPAAQREAAHG